MTPERWRRIDELYQKALALSPEQQRIFLSQACADDEELRREVESLLAVKSAAAAFFDHGGLGSEISSAGTPSVPPQDKDRIAKVEAEGGDSTAGSGQGRRFTYLAVTGMVVVFALQLLMSWFLLKYISHDRYGFRLHRDQEGVVIVEIYPGAPAAGKLQTGDRFLAVNGKNWPSHTSATEALRRIKPGEPCQILVRRGTKEQLISLSSTPYQHFSPRRLRYLVICFLRGLIYLSVLVLIVLLKRNDRFARIVAAAFWSLTVLNLVQMTLASSFSFNDWETSVTLVIWLLYGGLIFVPFGFHAALIFPPGAAPPETRFWRSLRAALYAMTAILTIPAWMDALAPYSESMTLVLSADKYLWFTVYQEVINWYFLLGLTCMGVALIRNYLTVKAPDQRRRMKLMVYGTLIAQFAAVLSSLAEDFQKSSKTFDGEWAVRYEVMDWFVGFATIVMAVAWAYGILTQRLYDVRVVVRRGLRYLLARNVLRVLLAAPVLALVYQVFSEPDRTVKEVFLSQPLSIFLIVLVSLSLYFRLQLRNWLDRRFFREQYNQEQVLYQLIDEIKEFDLLPELCRRVSDQLNSALHPSNVSFLFRQMDSRDMQLSYSSDPAAAGFSLRENSILFQVMKQRQTILEFPPPHVLSLPENEKQMIERLQIALLVPMVDSQGEFVGVMLLGEKMSEEPYISTDRRLLLAIARQMATVSEVTRLREHIEWKAKSEREVLARLAPESMNLLRECPQCGLCFDVSQAHCAKCGRHLALTLPVERTIENRYRLERTVGKGGMGAVYHATDLSLRRDVAIKIIKADYFGDQTALRRFEKEAQTAARLNHPNIIKVFDYGRTEAGGAWLVMELIEGTTLREELHRHGRLKLVLVAEWFDQLMEGVAAAHEAGVIHRDLKPENVLIDRGRDGKAQIKILDFGLAKLRRMEAPSSGSSSYLTQPGMLIGTPGYMSPEQLAGEHVGEQSDIFAIGAMLVESLTGNRPGSYKTPAADWLAILRQSSFWPGDDALHRVVQRCLAADPSDRYQTVVQLRSELSASLLAFGPEI
jgi:hypothetical protein